ncbi:MAG: hypothetical protein Q9165_005566 [Trypethelium subeluteriae]
MVSDSEEVYNGIVWQLVCNPFTPFLILFGEILSNGRGETEENEEALAAMEKLPTYLSKMSVRNSLAAKLQRVATILMQHARSVINPQVSHTGEAVLGPDFPVGPLPDPWISTGDMFNWDSFFSHAMTVSVPGRSQNDNHDAQPTNLTTWTNDFFGDAMIDWIGWDSRF